MSYGKPLQIRHHEPCASCRKDAKKKATKQQRLDAKRLGEDAPKRVAFMGHTGP